MLAANRICFVRQNQLWAYIYLLLKLLESLSYIRIEDLDGHKSVVKCGLVDWSITSFPNLQLVSEMISRVCDIVRGKYSALEPSRQALEHPFSLNWPWQGFKLEVKLASLFRSRPGPVVISRRANRWPASQDRVNHILWIMIFKLLCNPFSTLSVMRWSVEGQEFMLWSNCWLRTCFCFCLRFVSVRWGDGRAFWVSGHLLVFLFRTCTWIFSHTIRLK